MGWVERGIAEKCDVESPQTARLQDRGGPLLTPVIPSVNTGDLCPFCSPSLTAGACSPVPLRSAVCLNAAHTKRCTERNARVYAKRESNWLVLQLLSHFERIRIALTLSLSLSLSL